MFRLDHGAVAPEDQNTRSREAWIMRLARR
jgi:hypothetical protein